MIRYFWDYLVNSFWERRIWIMMCLAVFLFAILPIPAILLFAWSVSKLNKSHFRFFSKKAPVMIVLPKAKTTAWIARDAESKRQVLLRILFTAALVTFLLVIVLTGLIQDQDLIQNLLLTAVILTTILIFLYYASFLRQPRWLQNRLYNIKSIFMQKIVSQIKLSKDTLLFSLQSNILV